MVRHVSESLDLIESNEIDWRFNRSERQDDRKQEDVYVMKRSSFKSRERKSWDKMLKKMLRHLKNSMKGEKLDHLNVVWVVVKGKREEFEMSLRYCYSEESMQGRRRRKEVDDECSPCIRIRYSSDQRRNPFNATRLHGRLFRGRLFRSSQSSSYSLLFCQDSSFKAIYFGMLFCFLVILIPPATCASGESLLSSFKCLIQLILYFINQHQVHFLASAALINQTKHLPLAPSSSETTWITLQLKDMVIR